MNASCPTAARITVTMMHATSTILAMKSFSAEKAP